MPLINLGGGVFGAIKEIAIEVAAQPYLPYLRQLDAGHVKVLVEYGASLKTILAPSVLEHGAVRRLVELEPAILFRLLHKYHPALAKVLDTPAGRAWLEQQREELDG